MATTPQNPPELTSVQALVQLLRGRSYEEIRRRVYDNPPGSPWWAGCKSELDIRNSERTATALTDTARVSDKMRLSVDHLERLRETLLVLTHDMVGVVRGVRDWGRRRERSVYV